MAVKSFNLDDDVAEFVASKDNQSAFVNRCLRRVMQGYDPEAVIIDYQIEDLTAEISRQESMHEAAIKHKYERLSELKDRRERKRTQQENKRQEVIADFVRSFPNDFPLDPSEQTIKVKADKAGMDPETFVEAVRTERGGHE